MANLPGRCEAPNATYEQPDVAFHFTIALFPLSIRDFTIRFV